MRRGKSLHLRLASPVLGVVIGCAAGVASVTLGPAAAQQTRPRAARRVRRDAPSATSHHAGRACRARIRRPLRRRRRRGSRGWLRCPRRSLRSHVRTRFVRAACAEPSEAPRRRPTARRARSGLLLLSARWLRVLRAARGTRSRRAGHHPGRRRRRAACVPSTRELGRHRTRPPRVRRRPSRWRAGRTGRVGRRYWRRSDWSKGDSSALSARRRSMSTRPGRYPSWIRHIVDSCVGARARGSRSAYHSRLPGRSPTSPSGTTDRHTFSNRLPSPDATHSSGGSTMQVVSSRRSRRQSERRRRSGWLETAHLCSGIPPITGCRWRSVACLPHVKSSFGTGAPAAHCEWAARSFSSGTRTNSGSR